MGRLVRVPRPAGDDDLPGLEGMIAGTAGRTVQPDNYLERVAKYVPAEVIAFFIFINAILDQSIKAGGNSAMMAGVPVMTVAVIALVIACLIVPLFVWYVREDGDAWIINAVMSTLAFPFWAYALGAVAFSNYHDGHLAAILVAAFTVVSGLVAPRTQQTLRQAAVTPLPTRPERPQLDLVETNRL